MTDQCVPPYARPLPVVNDGGRCDRCREEIAELRRKLDAEILANRRLARDLLDARAAKVTP